MPSSSSSLPRRARASSSSFVSLPLLLLASVFVLLLTATPSLADGHAYPRRHAYHPKLPSSSTSVEGPRSPRPTPESGPTPPLEEHLAPEIEPLVKRDSATCFDTGTTVAQINKYFSTTPTTAGTLFLCPGATIKVDQTIYFRSSNQGLQTQGGTTVAASKRATLTVTNSSISTVIQANGCVKCNNLLVDSLIIDGGRATFGPLTAGGPLIAMGGTSQFHTISNSVLRNTRGWSSLHIIQGTGLSCSGAKILDNTIGPSGQSYGVGPIADGVSLACKNSFVQGNDIFDATDGAIVIFASPGAIVSGNTITSMNSVLLGGINMVDYAPYSGDYTGVQVYENSIMATGSQIKIGIAQGAANWGDSTTLVNFGGQVYNNTFGGTHLTFALSLAGVKDWKTTGNTAIDSTLFKGTPGSNCHGLGGTVSPQFAMLDPYKTSNLDLGTDANCWTQATLQYLLCYLADPDADGVAPQEAFLPGGSCSATVAPAAGTSSWKNSGLCLRDSATRILAGYWTNTAANSVELCSLRCTSLQYTYAGLENGKQCYCGNEINTAAGQGTVLASDLCYIPCPGNANGTCGGNSYTMSLWYDSSRVAAPVAPFLSTTATTVIAASVPTASSKPSSTSVSVKASSSSSSSSSSVSSSSGNSSFSSSTSVKPSSSSMSKAATTSSKPSSSSSSTMISSSSSSTMIISSTKASPSAAVSSSKISSKITTSSTSVKVSSSTHSSLVVASSSKSTSASSKPSSVSSFSSASSNKASSTTSLAPRSTTAAVPASHANGMDGPTCVRDVASRILQEYSFTDSGMTINLCTSTCLSLLYGYAALEYSNQCRCGNTLVTSGGGGAVVATSKCASNCAGDSASKCGGFYYASLFSSSAVLSSVSKSLAAAASTSSAVPSAIPSLSPAYSYGYTFKGCVQDVNTYILNEYSFESSDMTIAFCTSTCRSKSYAYAGLEYSSQCRCGNSLVTSAGGGGSLDARQCQMSCSGDSSIKCGGYYAMTLYFDWSLLASVSASSVSAASAAATASASASSTGWSAGDCVTDDGARLLKDDYMSSDSMTASMCQSFCSAYSYAGTEYGTQCYCGNDNTANSGHGRSPAACTSTCAGDPSQTCGGIYTMTLYKKALGSWSTPKCVTDGASRLLQSYAFEDAKMTNPLCQSRCRDLGYMHAATEWGSQCYCSSTLSTSTTVGIDSTSCTSKCVGDPSTSCGGLYIASLSSFS